MAASVSAPLSQHVERLHAHPAAEGGVRSGLSELIERLTAEGLISMKEAAKLYGRKTHKSTPARHHVNGVKLAGGATVRLEAIRVGGSLCTSQAAVLRFFAAQNEVAGHV